MWFESIVMKTPQETRGIREVCILDCNSPSYPPEDNEYLQCFCKDCIAELARHGFLLGHYGRPENEDDYDYNNKRKE